VNGRVGRRAGGYDQTKFIINWDQQQATEEGRNEYKQRAGVEGTLSQGVRRSDLRHCRYIGLAKTHLQHVATAVAMNVVRVANFLNEIPLAPTRKSRIARLCA
jgi:transposase